jgi:hypothetical protein
MSFISIPLYVFTVFASELRHKFTLVCFQYFKRRVDEISTDERAVLTKSELETR